MTARPSRSQREMLNFIADFIASHGYGPSYREIMRGFGVKSVSTVATHVNNLIAKGFLVKKNHSARSLQLVGVKDKNFTQKSNPTKAQEKWLVDLIANKFSEAASALPSQKQIDDLYVLVGALHVLGFRDAATSFKTKLQTITPPKPD